MNIVIAGDGEVGLHLAKELANENHNITIVDPHEELLKMVESHTDLMTITGDSTSIDVLKNANVKKADLLISVVHDEHINIITAILGKKLGAKKTIARINSLESVTEGNRELYQQLGIDALVCPEAIASQEIVHLLHQTAATEVFDFSEGKLSLFLIKLEKGAPVVNKTLNEIAQEHPHLDFRAVAIHRNSNTIIPRGEDVFLENDLSYVITRPEGVNDLLKLGGKQKIDIKNIMIVGGGRVGRTAAKQLEKEMNIKMFEIDKNRCIFLTDYLEDTLIVNGDARDIHLLEDEDIRSMDAFIAVTDNSETNILTCLHARKYGVKKTIALVENIDYIDISQNIGIDTIINKKLITASYIVRFTMGAEVTSIKCLSGIDAEVMEFVAQPGSAITKKPLLKQKIPQGAIVGGIVRGNESKIATGDLQIKENDHVVVFTLPKAIGKIEKLFS
ncbi:MAG: Trk system potassium transporter TrkA [Bacteroidales bacterium]|nr:Trk system potassium transporter TrkA [Bacteroidales bacterium]MCF8343897.1 Trk system potassium transporter TrkA [Bacteroidales bacterium]MCF8352356.1 Trk system potassium transporter TrkA [Bacteroidales bacterium]MCF8377478.1 Trk system potassium transporter TrkA [Bacteroidales bacterium]MCF8401601.1 Trk system potassium transporter TrkA [Bacteroidales bacterium]